MIRFTESSLVSRVVTSQMVRRPDSNKLYKVFQSVDKMYLGFWLETPYQTPLMMKVSPRYKVDFLQTVALLDCNMINGRTHTNNVKKSFSCFVAKDPGHTLHDSSSLCKFSLPCFRPSLQAR